MAARAIETRRATPADLAVVRRFLDDGTRELWQRPFAPFPLEEGFFEGKLVFVAEDAGEPVGCALGSTFRNATAHLNYVYVRPERRRQGVARAVLAAWVKAVREEGAEHVTLDVDTSNGSARALWDRLGFTEYARRLTAPLAALERRVAGEPPTARRASISVQTDDLAAVERAVRQFVPRLPGGSRGSVVTPPRNGWITILDELCEREPPMLRRLARELSDRMGAVVLALGLEGGEVVRYVLFEAGRVVDEYLSVPEHSGPLPPGDVVGLASNPTVLARLTGADPGRVRAIARTAASAAALPAPAELLTELAEAIGVPNAARSYAEAPEIDGALTIERE